MTDLQKKAIVEHLKKYIGRFESQNKAAHSLKAASPATISQMLNGNWELIKDEMWRNVAAQIGYLTNEWVMVETRDSVKLNILLTDAQNNSNVYAIVGDAGSGKTVALRQFTNSRKRVYLLQCNEYWNRKMFLQELLSTMGCDHSGYTVGEMMAEVVRHLKIKENPLIIMDESDKLSDQVMYFFITIYNQLEDHCGIVMCATNHLEKRIKRGIKLNKKGYTEIYSRIGRRFIKLSGVGSSDVAAICMANGVEDKSKIKEVMEDCEADLRRVKRKIHSIKQVSNIG